jgi:hypothetical protein
MFHFKFRNYGIEAYAIFRGGEIIPILKEMHSMHWKKRYDLLSNCDRHEEYNGHNIWYP